VAVGAYAPAEGGTLTGFTETDESGQWSAALTPVPDHHQSILEAVACLPTRACAAAGIFQNVDGATTGEVLADESGGTWTATSVPTPANASPLTAADVKPVRIACSAARSCVAAGTYATPGGSHAPLLAAQTGGTWSAVPVSGLGVGARTGWVGAVSCAPGGTCALNVNFLVGTAHAEALATWSTGSLHLVPAPVVGPAPATQWVNGLACPAPGRCVAAGDSTTSPGGPGWKPAVETLAAGTWTAQAVPVPADATATTTAVLDAVTCPDPGQCTVVGRYRASDQATFPFAATLTTGTWTAAALPEPAGVKTGAGARGEGLAVSCIAGACGAYGSYLDATGSQVPMLLSLPTSFSGYDLVGADGGVFVFPTTGPGSAYYGSLPGLGVVPAAPVVGMVATLSDHGYFLVGADGGVYAFGNAPYLGSLPGLGVRPARPITGIVAADGDHGYFLVGADGGVYAFGTVPFLGSLPGEHISVGNVIGIAATPSGNGYWLITATGTVYGFGAAQVLGTATGLGSPVSAIAGTPTGGGYWVTARNGAVRAFGAAADHGTLPALHVSPALPVVGIVRTADTSGYWLFAQDGGIFAFNAPYEGALPGLTPPVRVHDVVGAVPT
jgi:hypothetical protein